MTTYTVHLPFLSSTRVRLGILAVLGNTEEKLKELY